MVRKCGMEMTNPQAIYLTILAVVTVTAMLVYAIKWFYPRDYYTGNYLCWPDPITGKNWKRQIVKYDPTTQTATIGKWETAPDSSSVYHIKRSWLNKIRGAK